MERNDGIRNDDATATLILKKMFTRTHGSHCMWNYPIGCLVVLFMTCFRILTRESLNRETS